VAKLYEVTLKGLVKTSQAIWRSNWLLDNALAGTALNLAFALGYDPGDTAEPIADSILEAFLNACIGNSVAQSLEVRNIYDVTDFVTYALPSTWGGGLTGGAYMPTFVNGRIKSNRVRTDIRAGGAQTWGVPESGVDDADLLTGTALGAATTWADYMTAGAAGFVTITPTTWVSVIVQKQKYEVPDSDPVRYAYRYYPADMEATQFEKLAYPLTWTVQSAVSSQTSRKVGRGA
jgi:hypothetical protein